MCKWGTTVEMEVTIPAHLSHTGEARTKVIGVDACIAQLVAALNAGGITTVASCCGHGHLPGNVILADDTWLTLLTREQAQALNASIGVNIHGEPNAAAKRVKELESALRVALKTLQWWADSEWARRFEFDGVQQDPCGTHAALAAVRSALDGSEEREEEQAEGGSDE